jgi:hypothetical protein
MARLRQGIGCWEEHEKARARGESVAGWWVRETASMVNPSKGIAALSDHSKNYSPASYSERDKPGKNYIPRPGGLSVGNPLTESA